MKDSEGQYAPTVQVTKEGPPVEEAERYSRSGERLLLMSFEGSPEEGSMQQGGERGEGHGHGASDVEHQPNRGFGQGYENYGDELYTEIDVARLIHHLKESGMEVRPPSLGSHYIQSLASCRTLKPCREIAEH